MNQPPNQSTEALPTEPPIESLEDWRYAVYSESLALWKEQDPHKRAVISRQLAEWTGILAEMEAAEAQKADQPPQVGG